MRSIIIIIYIFILLLNLMPILTQDSSHELAGENIENDDEILEKKVKARKTHQNTIIHLFIFDYYKNFKYPIAVPELKENLIYTTYSRYLDIFEKKNREVEDCSSLMNFSIIKKIPSEIVMNKEYEQCRNREYKKELLAQSKKIEDDDQKEWRRTKCNNKLMLGLLDLQFFLINDSGAYRACIEIKDPLEEVQFIKATKKYLYRLLETPILEKPPLSDNFSDTEIQYIQSIYDISSELLIEYANFSTYYKYFPKLDNSHFTNLDFIFEKIYPKEKKTLIYNKLLELKKHQLYLLKDESLNGRKRGQYLYEYNREILLQIAREIKIINNNEYISTRNKNSFKDLHACLNKIPRVYLENISLGYTAGLFSRYANGMFTYDKSMFTDTEYKEIVHIYHTNFFQSKLVQLRLKNRMDNCNLLLSTPDYKLSTGSIVKEICELTKSERCKPDDFLDEL